MAERNSHSQTFDKDLQPTTFPDGDDAIAVNLARTSIQYMGKKLSVLCRQFSTHLDFVNIKGPRNVPQWWTDQRILLTEQINKFNIKLGGGWTTGGNNTALLYQNNIIMIP